MLLWLLFACGPDVQVVSATDLGPLEQSETIKGRDGGYSAPFGDRSVWIYGDSILSLAGEDGSSWRDNTWSWTDDLDASDGVTGFVEPTDAMGAPRELFPETEAEAAYNAAHAGEACAEEPCGAREILWPMAIVEDGARALVFYVKIHGEPGEWNFFSRGYGVAIWEDFEAGPRRPEPGIVADEPTLLFAPDEPAFGDAASIGPDGLLYAWGRDDDEGTKREMLGRVDPAEVIDRSAWTFWDGDGWNPDLSAAKPLFDGSSQMSVHHDAHLDRWLALYDDEPWGELVLRSAPAPEGPWSRAQRVIGTESPPEGWSYCGMLHPEYAREGTHLASYYRSTGDWRGEIRLVEVELE